MFLIERLQSAAVGMALTGLLFAGTGPNRATAQATAAIAPLPAVEPRVTALPLPEDRGSAALEQTLKRLGTTASVSYVEPLTIGNTFRRIIFNGNRHRAGN